MSKDTQASNTLGNASLALGITSTALVFGIGLCAWTGVTQNWIRLAGTPLFVCGGSSAFLGFLGFVLGLAGLFGKDKSKATAVVGLILGLVGTCMFFAFLSVIGNA
jgi:hypothetical protein